MKMMLCNKYGMLNECEMRSQKEGGKYSFSNRKVN